MKFLGKILRSVEERFLPVPKRFRLVTSVMILSLLMLLSTFFFFTESYIFIPVLILASYALTFFSVLEGLERFEWFSLFLMPVLITVSFYLFFFLFPVRWITRVPFLAIYGVSIYASILCSNIFNVGVEKSLQLYRAAFSVNFFYQTIVSFLLFNAIFSFRLNFIFNALLVGMIAFFMALQLLWTVKLDLAVGRDLPLKSFLVALILGEAAMVISFMPLRLTIVSLFLTAIYYSITGLMSHFMAERLFRETIREYAIVLGFTVVILLLSLNW